MARIACGACAYCRAGYYAQCDAANPNGPGAGTAVFGGPAASGPFHGLQAEKARVPFANVTCVKLPEEVTDDRMQIERAVRLAAMQINRHANDRDVRHGQRVQHELPPRKTQQSVGKKVEQGIQQVNLPVRRATSA